MKNMSFVNIHLKITFNVWNRRFFLMTVTSSLFSNRNSEKIKNANKYLLIKEYKTKKV